MKPKMRQESEQEIEQKKRAGKNRRNGYRIAAFGITLCLAVCIACLAKYLVDINRAQKQFEALKDSYVQADAHSGEREDTVPGNGNGQNADGNVTDETAGMTEEERRALLERYRVPEKEIDFAALQSEQNKDIYAWITVQGTKIDYPILQHPEQLDYYLDYNMDGTKGYPGCIYSQLMNSRDFSDRVTILYGHNMKNGTMFANLHYYEDPVFFEAQPYVYVYTGEEILIYEVFAACEYHNGHILMYNNVVSDEGYQKFIDDIYQRDGMNNQYNENARPGVEDKILILSTCIKDKAEKRWIVATVLRERLSARSVP